MNELQGLLTSEDDMCSVLDDHIECPRLNGERSTIPYDTGGKHLWCQGCIFLSGSTHNKKLKEIIPILIID